MVLIDVLVFIIGLSLGSFLNVVIMRLGVKEGILMGRSECLNCLAVLKWYDLVPLFSFFVLKGRCRYCAYKISFVYPLVEAFTGFVLLALFLNHWPSMGLSFFVEVLLALGLIVILFFDARNFIIPDVILFPLMILESLFLLYSNPQSFLWALVWGFLYAGFFAILYLVSKGSWMGFGDVKLVFLIGLVIGYPAGFWVIVLSVWAAAIFGLLLMAIKKATPKTALPFGSFLSFTLLFFIIFGHVIETRISIIHRIF